MALRIVAKLLLTLLLLLVSCKRYNAFSLQATKPRLEKHLDNLNNNPRNNMHSLPFMSTKRSTKEQRMTTLAMTSLESSSPAPAPLDDIVKNDATNDAGAVVKGEQTPKDQYDSIVCGGGPAGLLTAIMLSQKYGPSHRIAVCERRPTIPPSPTDDTFWNDIARFYLLGIGHRGQAALKQFGVFEDFFKASVEVKGRKDWVPGATKIEDGKETPAKKDVMSRILPRDKLVGLLHLHIVENYSDASIDMLYGFEVDPISFGSDDDDIVRVRISKCEEVSNNGSTSDNEPIASQDADQLCDVDTSQLVTTKLLIGADGSARTVANAMEHFDANRFSKLNRLQRLTQPKPFKVTRFVDSNPIVYKSVPIVLPSTADWPYDLNYSARSRDSRITLEALPSNDKGNLCALLLMKPDDELAQDNVDPAKLRLFFDEEFPQFGGLVNDEEMARVAKKEASTLPAFRFAGPRLNMGRRTLVLGDAAHTVKPYFGQGANTALEDVQVLSEVLDEAARDDIIDATNADNSNKNSNAVPKAVKMFSDRRSGDAEALVRISRKLDSKGKLFFVNFILPLILDGVFHKMAPKIFGPNIFGMFQKKGIGFKVIQRKKRLDRAMQIACLGTLATSFGFGLRAMVGIFASGTGKDQRVVTVAMVAADGMIGVLRKAVASIGMEPQVA